MSRAKAKPRRCHGCLYIKKRLVGEKYLCCHGDASVWDPKGEDCMSLTSDHITTQCPDWCPLEAACG